MSGHVWRRVLIDTWLIIMSQNNQAFLSLEHGECVSQFNVPHYSPLTVEVELESVGVDVF